AAHVKQLAELEKLLEPALKDLATLQQMAERLTEWEGLEDEIDKANKALTALKNELQQLQAQYRVARDEELGRQIDKLERQIKSGEELEHECAALEKELKATKRPEAADVSSLQKLQSRITQARAKMEATGVRYELSASQGPRTLRVAEDGQPE